MDENRTPNQEQQGQPQEQSQNQGQPQQSYQPQYQQSQYQQPQYQPQSYTPYYAPQPKPANRGKGGGWIGFLRVMAWVLFAVVELVSLIGGIMMMANAGGGYWGFSWGVFFSGLLIIVGGTLLAFIMIAAINVSLDMAMNTVRTATNTAKLVEKIEDIEKKIK